MLCPQGNVKVKGVSRTVGVLKINFYLWCVIYRYSGVTEFKALVVRINDIGCYRVSSYIIQINFNHHTLKLHTTLGKIMWIYQLLTCGSNGDERCDGTATSSLS